MSKERDDKFDPNQPALIVKYGDAKHRRRPIDRDVLVLGRAPGCDVGLDAPDVAPVHCVIVRSADGWRIRDCTGKGGTRLNGQSVHDSVLNDEDVIQVGSFSFEMHLPPDHQPLATADPGVRHAEHSRHNLARLALRLRGKVAEMAAAAAEQAERQHAARQDELDRQAEQLRVLQHDVDQRFAEPKQTAQELAGRNAALEERRRRVEQESIDREAERRALEESHGRALAEKEQAVQELRDETSRGLEVRARELGSYAGHLRRLRQRLHEHEDSLTARWEEWLREQQEASIAQAQQREQMAREQALLREQRSEIVQMMTETRQLRQQPDAHVEALREENEHLRRGLAERDAAAASAREEAQRCTEEAVELRARLAAHEDGDAVNGGALQRFVVELDTGRRILDEQVRDLQGRFADLERSAQEAEVHIARERVRMVQERLELERLRGGLWPDGGRSPGAETLVDAPSPFRHIPEMASAPETADVPE